MKNKIAIQMDDIKTIDFDFDSSFIIGLEGQRRNYDLFYYHPNDLFIDQGEVKAKGFFLELFDQKTNYFKFLSDKTEVKLEEFKFIFLRQDPPFNMHYITSTFILDCLPKSTVVVNNPTSVRNAAEKIFPFEFKEFMPPTIIAQKVEQIKNFFKIHKDIITKPLYGNGGEGIHRSQDGLLEGIDIHFDYIEMPIMAQKYIPEFSELQCKDEKGEVYSCENDLKILHLMTHRSGYTYYGNPLNFTSTIKYDNLDDFITDVSKHPVEFEPGSNYLYGINQAILGKVVEVVSGKSFYEYLKVTIFDPLEMNETKFYLTSDERERFHTRNENTFGQSLFR